jgi:hypothetical protein
MILTPNPILPRQLLATFLMLCFCLTATGSYAQTKKPKASTVAKKIQPAFTYKIINGANSTFGYNLYADGVMKIHQPSIPAMPGNDGFKTKAAAEQVARLAIKKMKNGESLPTISKEELKKLKAI